MNQFNWISRKQLNDDTLALAGLLPPDIVGVAGVPRSGLMVASMIATHLNIKLHILDDENGYHELPGGRRTTSLVPQEGTIVLIDDSVMTNETMEDLRDRYPHLPTAAVYVNPAHKYSVDYIGKLLQPPHWFEWHAFGSDMVTQCAFDMDGMICEDCPLEMTNEAHKFWVNTVKPRWLPRPHKVAAIVTARLEQHREATERWLDRHGVTYEQLIMGPWESEEERMQSNVAEFKGEEVRHINCRLFFESDPRQCQTIARFSGKTVVCPPTGEVFT